MGGGDELNDAESQPATAALARQTLIHLVERLENSFPFTRGDPNAVVLDGNRDLAVFGSDPQQDVFNLFRVFVRILEQVDQRRHQGARVSHDLRKMASAPDLELATRSIESPTHRFHGSLDNREHWRR